MTLSATTQALLDEIITKQEGGWILSKDADGGDGGWTYAGVTATTFQSYITQNQNDYTYYQLVKLQQDNSQEWQAFKYVVYTILFTRYVPSFLEQLPVVIQGPYLSACINEGDHSPEEILQRAINKMIPARANYIEVDGIVGNVTISAAVLCAGSSGATLLSSFLFCWLDSYISICISKPEKLQFLKGWHARVEYWRNRS